MKKFLILLSVLFLFATSANATIIFSDNFNSENSGNYALNYTGFANWFVNAGSVDLIGEGSFWDYFPGYGLYVDLDGSTGTAGALISNVITGLTAGQDYVFEYDLAGSQRSGTDTTDVSFWYGSLEGTTHVLDYDDPFETYSFSFTAVGSVAQLGFFADGGDNIGMLLDNVVLKTAPVPEPATMLLLGVGLVGLAGVGRKKFFKK